MAVKLKSDDVLSNLNKAILKIEGRTQSGLNRAGVLIKEDSIKKTPVDTGNLKSSHYLQPLISKTGPAIEIGTLADYSIYVHENLEARHTVGEAKFLEKAIKQNIDRIKQIIKDNVKL